ncbi:PKD domain-containing protein [Taibaiella koreensis]|uniref:PKD domain-containing protein n=1 Tax=Taibaiella koreensis TaxID=1268548 RepID=UPI0013C2CC61|nr:PKD domain-containing protein [Taibaiella koreensis]
MKKCYFLLALAGLSLTAGAQGFNYELTGNPVVTTGWTVGPQSSVDGDNLVLTSALGNQAGYVYYSTPQNLTSCAQFTVTFDFSITNSSIPTADGICFWYISNPPTGFTLGGGIGLPNNPDGLLLIMDTYDNDGTPNNPLVSLRRLDGTVNYVEGSTTGQLAPDLLNQAFIADGNWHTCLLRYNFGTVTVAFDGNPPVMTGAATLGLNGYFGFSSGTGGSWARHAIRNVSITGAPEPDPPAGNDVTYCQGAAAAPLTAAGSNMSWFTTPTGGTALPGAPTPSTAVPGTYNWYVSQAIPNCNVESKRDTVTVTVNPKPAPPVIHIPNFCSGQTSVPLTVTSGVNVLWYTQPTGGTGDATIPVISTATADTFTWYVTQTNAEGCESDRAAVTVIVHQTPAPNFSYSTGYGCLQDTIRFNNLTTGGASSYSWNFGDGVTDNTTNPVHVFDNQNTYIVRLRASNLSCTDSTLKSIVLEHPLQAAFSTSADTICQGGSITFTNSSVTSSVRGIAPSWLWHFGDGSGTSALKDPAHTFAAPGSYPVMLVAKNDVPCTDTFWHTVVVDSLPQLTLGRSDTSICQGQITTFFADYTQNGLTDLQWNFGENADLLEQKSPGVRHAFEQPGTYTITLGSSYRACPGGTATTQLLVKPMPHIDLGADTSICLDAAPLTLTDAVNAADPKATWRWSSGEKTASIQVRHDGRYTATVTIDQCSSSDDVVVTKDCYTDVPNSFTPNGDGVNDYFFPRQYLSKGVSGFVMTVYNRWGQKVFETENPNGRGWDGRFNDKTQPTGVYIYAIKVVLKNGRAEEYTGNVTLLR